MVTKGPRPEPQHHWTCPTCQTQPHGGVAAEHRLINRLLASTNEQVRRLLAGFLARQLGPGGISQLHRISGLDRKTIAKGLHELHQGPATPLGRIRQAGGGRKPVESRGPGS